MINSYVIDDKMQNFVSQKRVLDSRIADAKKAKKEHSVAVKTFYANALVLKTEYTYTFTE